MAVINKNWLYLAEGYTGSRATAEALLQLPGSKSLGSHHSGWPYLKAKRLFDESVTTFSVVRHPLDIIATQVAKGSRHPVSYWLIRRYRHRDAFFMHNCTVTLRYEAGLSRIIGDVIHVRGCYIRLC